MRCLVVLLSGFSLFLYAEEPASAPSPEEAAKEISKGETLFVLTVKEEEARAIDEIITTLGRNSVISLGFKKSRLQSLGRKVQEVSSLQFLGYIFSKQELKQEMRSIRRSSLKWNKFIDGLKPGLERAATNSSLFKQLPGFCTFLQVEYNPLLQIAEARKWNSFVDFLTSS